jgi:hypothetical protein
MNEINWNEMIGFLNDVYDMVEEFTKLFAFSLFFSKF